MNDSPHTLRRLSDWYKRRIRIHGLGVLLKATLECFISTWARLKGFSFPEKFIWEWKMEMLDGSYEKDTTDLFRETVRPGMTVIDIGAHIGYFTRLFSALTGPSGRVFAFEPDPQNWTLLKKNTARCANVTIIKAAISDTTGVIDFYEIEDSTACHSTIPSEAPSKKLSVKAVTLDGFMKETGVSIDIIKIDIEGSEMHAFKGMAALLGSARALRIVCELNPGALARAGSSPKEMIDTLASFGFSAYAIVPGGPVPLNPRTLDSLPFMKGKEEYLNVLFVKEK